ncbi:putative geraniol 8-hydroxylase [Helianthus annuus]|uniref:Geraniol 8-hydroxylase n=1 Tax=Helianthus annuus TaxID=4232 RepID=A0A9K3HPP4_HELAN|nr:putative geraniol 8-hydroxylase [Helianthus annuus]KAJ0875536.1 putative geraniol 8-hydroxylase [Helianthus annuus]
MSFSLFLLLTPLFLVFIIRKYLKSGKKLPPGPRPWPIIGNLNQVGKNPHVSTAILAQEHGGLISLHLGTQRLDLQGLRKQTLRHVDEVFDSWVGIINERRSVAAANKEHCFLDCLIENGFSNEQINVLALELFTAGTDTTTSTIEWAMAELIKNKNVMFELQEELKHKINSNTIVESEISNLPYLNACIKETLRLHPPAPLLLPHRAIQTCEVLNYTIPRGAQILVNIWAIGRDPKIWEDPLSFKPERFLGSSLDFRGKDFEFIPFGAGRRMCPGLPSGITSVQSILASLILRFDWILPSDQDPVKLDMNEKFGVTLQKNKPLQLIFKHLN